ncbi:MAG: hypothetical protein PF488_03945 [Patescibacteria group bacterium]|jgi:hypothetical protein|nr:hypothetical protein [Patescibacteria group bacterium]
MVQRNSNNRTSGGNTNNYQPEMAIRVSPTSQIIDNVCEVSLEVSVLLKNRPMVNQEVILKEGNSRIAQPNTAGSTGVDGIVTLNANFPLRDKEYQKVLRISLTGKAESLNVPLLIPAKTEKKKQKNISESLVVMKYQNDNGQASFKCRVLTTDGDGVPKKQVTIWYKGSNKKRTTDNNGEAFFYPSSIIEPGEENAITFSVSGIKESAKLKLRRKKKLKQAKAFSSKWWLGVNNGRAFILMLLAIFFWILAIGVGFGDPIISRKLFVDENGISPYQKLYNETLLEYGQEIKTFESDDYFFFEKIPKKSIWKIAFFLTIAFFIYFPIAAREEIADALDDVRLKLVDKGSVKVDDPFFEKLLASTESLGFASNKSNKGVQFGGTKSFGLSGGGAKNPQGKEDDKAFGSSMWSYMALDIATDLLMGIVKRVFK